MDKNAMMKESRTPCEYCGQKSCIIIGGIAACPHHMDQIIGPANRKTASGESKMPRCATAEINDALDKLGEN